MTEAVDRQRLESWKSIARYLDRSVRTVRRWEQSERLPVHRHMHQAQATVYAYAHELDQWRAQRSELQNTEQDSGSADADIVTRRRASTVPAIVVMPFGFAGADQSQAWVAEGISEELISSLSGIHQLRVISRTSSLSLKSTSQDARAIGKALKVTHLLEGSVVSDGEQLRIVVRLIDTSNDDRLWSQRFDASIATVFDVLESLSRAVVEALRVRLSSFEDNQLSARQIEHPAAWQKLVQARQLSLRWRKDAIDQAVVLLNEAIAINGPNAILFAALGRTTLHYIEAGISTDKSLLETARSLAHSARELDPDAAETHQLRGWISYMEGDVSGAIAQLEISLRQSPGNADTLGLLANCYLLIGNMRSAREMIRRVLEVDPLTPLSQCLPGWADAMEGNFTQAVGPYRAMFESDSGNPVARLFYIWILAINGQEAEVKKLIRQSPDGFIQSPPGQIAQLFSDGLSGSNSVQPLTPDTFPPGTTNEMFPRLLAQAHALAKQPEQALAWLKLAVERGLGNYPYLARHDPFFKPYWQQAEWADLLSQVRKHWSDQQQRS